MRNCIRVMIVDDQRLLCEGFRELLELEPDLDVVALAENGEEALAIVEQLHAKHTEPDVVLMDIRMPRLDGITTTRLFKERWPAIRIIILTTFDDKALIRAGLQAGAFGYVLKDITAEQLATAIRGVAQGQVLLHPEVAHKMVTSLLPSPFESPESSLLPSSINHPPLFPPLTERERDILALLAQGASNREISEALFIAGGTVKNHISNLLAKLGVRDRTQAALKAKEFGLA